MLGWRIKARDSEASGFRVGTLCQICLQVTPWDDIPYLEDNPGMGNKRGDPALRPAPRATGRWRGNHTGARKKAAPRGGVGASPVSFLDCNNGATERKIQKLAAFRKIGRGMGVQ